MTQAQLQKAIAAQYDGEAEAPAITSDDWLLRQELLNEGLHVWETDRWWKELLATDSSETITAGDYTYACATDFFRPLGWVWTQDASGNKTYYQHIKRAQATRMDKSARFYYLSGDPINGYSININPNLTLTTGHTLYIDYVKKATVYTASTTTSECSDPYFLVFYVLWKLYEQDGDTTKAQGAKDATVQKLMAMRQEDELMGYDQPNRVEDNDFSLGFGGFGV